MSFSEVTGTRRYAKYTECIPGTVLVEGWYFANRPNKFTPNANDYLIKEPNQTVFVLNKSGIARFAFEEEGSITFGDYVRITYLGKKPMPNGTYKGKDAVQLKIEKDPSRRMTPAQFESIDKCADGVDVDNADMPI